MKLTSILIALLCTLLNGSAQTNPGSITLTVTDAKNHGIKNAGAALLKHDSKQLVKTALANKDGKSRSKILPLALIALNFPLQHLRKKVPIVS